MTISAGNNLYIAITQTGQGGSAWIVKLYKKGLIFKKVISSDWFLDGEQAKTFARKLASDLQNDGSLSPIRTRKPGWTLHRPVR